MTQSKHERCETVLSYKKLQQLTGEGLKHSEEFKILLVDDNVYDSELTLRELKRQKQIKFTSLSVTNKSDYDNALTEFLPDVVYCDYNIARDFTAVTAVRKLKRDYPDVPFVLVTGTFSDEVASICIHEGINDYVLKSNMSRLQLSLFNAIKIRKMELQKKKAYEKLVKSEAQIRNFARHLNQVLEDERAHLAREIHDELGQQLTGIKIGIYSFNKLREQDDKTKEKIKSMMEDIDHLLQSLRKIATELRPGILDSLGLMPSIHWLAKEFEKKTGIKCMLDLNVGEQQFEKNISTNLFRICQEALNNISKHSGATEVTIHADQNRGRLAFNIHDNGRGIATEKLENPFSMGLLGMRERASIIGADLTIESKKNEGTTVQLEVNVN